MTFCEQPLIACLIWGVENLIAIYIILKSTYSITSVTVVKLKKDRN